MTGEVGIWKLEVGMKTTPNRQRQSAFNPDHPFLNPLFHLPFSTFHLVAWSMDFLHECTAFVFDMDGLLFDTERLSRRALHAAAAEMGVALAEDAFLELIGRRMGDIHGRLAKRVGNDDLATRLLESSEKHYEILLMQGVPVKEGAEDLLTWLAAGGWKCAVATSTRTVKAERKLVMAKLRGFLARSSAGTRWSTGSPRRISTCGRRRRWAWRQKNVACLRILTRACRRRTRPARGCCGFPIWRRSRLRRGSWRRRRRGHCARCWRFCSSV